MAPWGGKPDTGLLTAKLQDELVQETRTDSPAQIWLLLGGGRYHLSNTLVHMTCGNLQRISCNKSSVDPVT